MHEASDAVWIKHVPQLAAIKTSRLVREDGDAVVPGAPGLRIDWAVAAIERLALTTVAITG
jgi:hypothetical protein